MQRNWLYASIDRTYRDNIDKCRFPWVLQSNQRQFHFLFPKDAFDPIQNTVEYRNHFVESEVAEV